MVGSRMEATVYWISNFVNGGLGVMARPRGGDWLEDEIKSLKRSGVDTVVSLLEGCEVTELGLSSEPALCRDNDLEYLSFPIADRHTPSSGASAASLIRAVAQAVSAGKRVVIHCRNGIGRSTMIGAAVLVALGTTPESAFKLIAEARGRPVPDTEEQEGWVFKIAANLQATPGA